MEIKDFISPITFVISLWVVIRHFKFTKTLEAIDYFSSESMMEIRWSLDKWFEKKTTDEDRLSEIKTDEEREKELRILLSALTRISACYKFKLLNRKHILAIWGDMLLRYHDQLQFYLKYKRQKGRSVGFLFDEMIESIKRTKKLP